MGRIMRAMRASTALVALAAAPRPGASQDGDEVRAGVGGDIFSDTHDSYLFPDGKVKADGACPALLYLPFTDEGGDYVHYGPGQETSWAYSHLSAAILAMDHFNKRDASVVPELQSDPIMENCTVYFPTDDVSVSDTESTSSKVAPHLMNYPNALSRCAIFGPYTNEASLETSTMATGLGIPFITHGAEDYRLYSEALHPNALRTSVHLHAMGDMVISALRSKGRTDFLNMIYTSHDYGVQFSGTVDNAAKEQGFSRIFHHKIGPPYTGTEVGRSAYIAMENIKKTTYRTIFVAMHDAFESLNFIADAAEAYGLIGPEYFWMFSGNVDWNYALYGSDNANTTKLLRGSAFVRQMENFYVDPNGDKFLNSWKSQDSTLVERVNALNPIKKGEPGYYNPPREYFQVVEPQLGSGFMYDAVMAIGMGACRAWVDFKKEEEESPETRRQLANAAVESSVAGKVASDTKDGQLVADGGSRRARERKLHDTVVRSPAADNAVPAMPARARRMQEKKTVKFPWQKTFPRIPHVVGVSNINFTGATGMVKYRENKRFYKNRDRKFFTYGIYNIRDVDEAEKDESIFPLQYILTDVLTEGGPDGEWRETENAPFIFADGTANQPKLLRAIPEQNYLSRGARITGLLFMSIALATILMAVAFVVWKNNHPVVRAAQPNFLYAFAFGATIMTFSILTLSWDESYGWSVHQLTAACQATPWLVALGYVILYCAIFSKLWRINKVLQFRRRQKVEAKHVSGPFLGMVVCTVVILSVWTAIDPLTWEREVIDDFTGESYGRCRSDHSIAFLIPLAVIMVASTILAAYMAWKTKDVQAKFSESEWIFYTIFVQLQVLIVGIPVIVILTDQSTNAAYIGRALVIWTIPMTTVLLLIGPKACQVFSPKKEKPSRGVSMAPGGVAVSGLSNPIGSSALFSGNSSVLSRGSTKGTPMTGSMSFRNYGRSDSSSAVGNGQSSTSSVVGNGANSNGTTLATPGVRLSVGFKMEDTEE